MCVCVCVCGVCVVCVCECVCVCVCVCVLEGTVLALPLACMEGSGRNLILPKPSANSQKLLVLIVVELNKRQTCLPVS